jgi:hypothetical protein
MMILELKHDVEHVSDIHTVACVYWKIPDLNKKRHTERNPEGRTGVSGCEYCTKKKLYTLRPCDKDKTTVFCAT